VANPSRYVWVIFAALTSFILLSIAANETVFQDRFLSCDRHYSRKVAAALLGGETVEFGTDDFLDRCVTQEIFKAWAEPKDVIAIGSSRTMQIKATLFTPRTFYNAAIWAARMNDYFALARLLEQDRRLPKTLIIGLDDFTVDEFDDDPRWIMLADQSTMALAELGAWDGVASNIRSWVKDSLKRLGGDLSQGGWHALWLVASKCLCLSPFQQQTKFLGQTTQSDHLIKLPDGSVIYETSRRLASGDNMPGGTPTFLFSKHVISPMLMSQFWLLTDYLRRHSVEPVIWLAPYAPPEYAMMMASPNGQMTPQVEAIVRAEAAKRKIRVVGSYNPENIPCKKSEFIDWWHPGPACVARAFSS
jgi:hypothetical protein